ncbi:MAG: LysM peptidoglycan-binding domain-containing protein, partial [Caldilineaceae bacterium]|nr:LysM peptidoglycan-binding domain-containing protein [Caldilineaceae bacterium]
MFVRGLLFSLAGIALIAYLLVSSLGTQEEPALVLQEQALAASVQSAPERLPTSAEDMLVRPLAVEEDMRDSYCLWPDDTLGGIAAAAGITVDQIMAANPDYTGFAGSTIFLPEGSIPPHEWTTPRPSVPT